MAGMAAEAGGVTAAGTVAVAAATGGAVHAASAAAGICSVPADAWDGNFQVPEASVNCLRMVLQGMRG